jgi:hypothetical protein
LIARLRGAAVYTVRTRSRISGESSWTMALHIGRASTGGRDNQKSRGR